MSATWFEFSENGTFSKYFSVGNAGETICWDNSIEPLAGKVMFAVLSSTQFSSNG